MGALSHAGAIGFVGFFGPSDEGCGGSGVGAFRGLGGRRWGWGEDAWGCERTHVLVRFECANCFDVGVDDALEKASGNMAEDVVVIRDLRYVYRVGGV